MKTYLEPAKSLPVVHETDLVVVGGSCTGVFAAVRAARLGARVAIVEKQNVFGGVATTGLVNIWHNLNDTEGAIPIIGGLTREVIERLRKRNAVTIHNTASAAFRINTEELKIELDELIREHRIDPYLHTLYVAPVLNDGVLEGVIIENKNGRQVIGGRQFVDASGDGMLLRHAGVPFDATRPFQPPTTTAKIAGYTTLNGFDWQAAVRDHGEAFGLRKDWGWGGPVPGLADVQLRVDGHVFDLDTEDADQMTRAEMEGRRQVRATLDLIRRHGPANGELTLVDLCAEIGVRETRRMKARYRVAGEDVLHGRGFEDAIANGSYPVDIHHADGPGITFRFLDGTEHVIPERGVPAIRGRWRDPLPKDPTFYQIPLRALIPHCGIPNLMGAGRMLDADKTAFSALRVMVNLNQTGEAAGTTCALALQQNCTIDAVDPRRVRQSLADGGSVIL